MMKPPFWERSDVVYVEINDSDDWMFTERKCVEITRDASVTHLQWSFFLDTQCLLLDIDLNEEQQIASLQLLHNKLLPNLRSLSITFHVSAQCAMHLTRALQRQQQLQQLKIWIAFDSDVEAQQSAFEAIGSMPLFALFVGMVNRGTKHTAQQLCAALQKHQTLMSLELRVEDAAFASVLFERLVVAPQLRILRMPKMVVGARDIEFLCAALEQMPYLQELHVHLGSNTCWRFAQFFDAAFRPLEKLVCHFEDDAETAVLQLFVALKNNTRLRMLDASGSLNGHAFQSSNIAEAGWLADVKWHSKFQPARSVMVVVKRNWDRHVLCRRMCTALIVIRKSRRSLNALSVGVIILIAMLIWSTRNQSVWDK